MISYRLLSRTIRHHIMSVAEIFNMTWVPLISHTSSINHRPVRREHLLNGPMRQYGTAGDLTVLCEAAVSRGHCRESRQGLQPALTPLRCSPHKGIRNRSQYYSRTSSSSYCWHLHLHGLYSVSTIYPYSSLWHPLNFHLYSPHYSYNLIAWFPNMLRKFELHADATKPTKL